jgi:hypothetical protein
MSRHQILKITMKLMARSEVLTAVTVRVTVFWDTTSRTLLTGAPVFRELG